MAIQRVGPRPRSMVQQTAAGFKFDGTRPTNNVPTFGANGGLVFATEVAADGSGLFEFEQDRTLVVVRVHIEVPSADVAGWSLYITDGTLDVLVDSSTTAAASYVVDQVPIVLMRGENLKLIMVGPSAGLIRADAAAATVDNAAHIPSPAATAAAAAAAAPGDNWDMQRTQDPGNDTYRARRSHQNEKVLSVFAMATGGIGTTAGSYTLDVRKNSTTAANGTSVLSAAVDLETLSLNTWLAGTVLADGSEDLAAGDDLRAWLISDNADLAGFTDGINVCVAIGVR